MSASRSKRGVNQRFLRTLRSTITLVSLQSDDLLSSANAKAICEALFEHFAVVRFEAVSVAYISALFDVYKICDGLKSPSYEALRAAVIFILNEGMGEATDDSFEVIEWGLDQLIVTPEQAMSFVSVNIEQAESETEIKAMTSLLLAIPDETPGYDQNAHVAKEHVLDLVSDCFSDFIDVDFAFSRVEYGDVQAANNELTKLVEQKLVDFGIDVSEGDIARVVDYYDVADGLNSYFENSYDGDDREADGPRMHAVDEIEDLFDRG